MKTCERCGSDNDVRVFYGKELCKKTDDWLACSYCRMEFIDIRLNHTSAELRGKEKPKPEPEPEPEPRSGQMGLTDYI